MNSIITKKQTLDGFVEYMIGQYKSISICNSKIYFPYYFQQREPNNLTAFVNGMLKKDMPLKMEKFFVEDFPYGDFRQKKVIKYAGFSLGFVNPERVVDNAKYYIIDASYTGYKFSRGMNITLLIVNG